MDEFGFLRLSGSSENILQRESRQKPVVIWVIRKLTFSDLEFRLKMQLDKFSYLIISTLYFQILCHFKCFGSKIFFF